MTVFGPPYVLRLRIRTLSQTGGILRTSVFFRFPLLPFPPPHKIKARLFLSDSLGGGETTGNPKLKSKAFAQVPFSSFFSVGVLLFFRVDPPCLGFKGKPQGNKSTNSGRPTDPAVGGQGNDPVWRHGIDRFPERASLRLPPILRGSSEMYPVSHVK